MEHWEMIHTEERDGFLVTFSVAPETKDPRGQFMLEDGSDDEKIIERIHSGYYAWFIARVEASRAGIVLGTDYLGACCYESAQAFVTEDGYYPDMVDEALTAARATLASLCAQ